MPCKGCSAGAAAQQNRGFCYFAGRLTRIHCRCTFRVARCRSEFDVTGQVPACFSQVNRTLIADPMTAEENRRGTVSIEVSPHETEVDPQLSACAIDSGQDGPPPHQLPDASAPEEYRS